MQGSTIDVVSSRLIAGIIALRRSFGLEQGQLPADPASRIASTPSAQATPSGPARLAATETASPVQPTAAVAPTSGTEPAAPVRFSASVPASMVNPSRQWIDFSMIEEFDEYAPRGTYLDVTV